MKKITVAIVGGGSRGSIYSKYILDNPYEVQLVAVAEPDQVKRKRIQNEHKIQNEKCFSSWDELLSKPKLADSIVIATLDRMHFEPVLAAMEKGYHILLEKPMSYDPLECLIIGNYAQKYNKIFNICYSMRHLEISQQLKKILDEGRIGRLVTVTHTENVAHWHYAHSFVRGNWSNSKESSSMILQKSCHDMDFLLWLIGSECEKISSFGDLTYFKEENAPVGAPARCTDGCPYERECPYNAMKFYLNGKPGWPNYCLCNDTGDLKSMLNALKKGPYGRCVFRCNNDVVDHQVVNFKFRNGVTAVFTMSAFTQNWGRTSKFMGTKGEIRFHSEKAELEILDFISGSIEIIKSKSSIDDLGHGGSDERMFYDFVKNIGEGNVKESQKAVGYSVHSHIMAFAAERSRLLGECVDVLQYEEELRSQKALNREL